MSDQTQVLAQPAVLSVVIPCFNEEKTLSACVSNVLAIADDSLRLQVIIVDDCSVDRSLEIAEQLKTRHPEIDVFHHAKNQGKGAALRTGIAHATGDYVAVQDADLEYSPQDLKRLLVPLINGDADVVFGSRFQSTGSHRVLYFWHSLGNKFLTFLSNMLTDLNLTDMETGYKVFRREVVQSIEIEESRFGFEPEIVAKVAQRRLRLYEMGISYRGRTYAEGKKIGVKDGFRALYCILRYNLHSVPVPIQFFFYVLIGGTSALANLLFFLLLIWCGVGVGISAPIAFSAAAGINYWLSIVILFRHNARWGSATELALFLGSVAAIGYFDLVSTQFLIAQGSSAWVAKSVASGLGLGLNFGARRFLVFPEPPSADWSPQEAPRDRHHDRKR
jgi:glycosyltransferase involved in cell wall biosynthesis